MTGAGRSSPSGSSASMLAGLMRAKATDSVPLPGMATLKYVSFRDTTLYGPEYGAVSYTHLTLPTRLSV